MTRTATKSKDWSNWKPIVDSNLTTKPPISQKCSAILKFILAGLVLQAFGSPPLRPGQGKCDEKRGDVAQLVEQRTENPCVGGSIPSITTKTEREWSARALKLHSVFLRSHILSRYFGTPSRSFLGFTGFKSQYLSPFKSEQKFDISDLFPTKTKQNKTRMRAST